VRKPLDRFGKISRRAAVLVIEGAEMHLVDDELIPGGHLELVIAPFEAVAIDDDGRTVRMIDVARVGILPLKPL
jgi:hypothetical protein